MHSLDRLVFDDLMDVLPYHKATKEADGCVDTIG